MGIISEEKGFFRTADTTYLGYVTNTAHDTKIEVALDFDHCYAIRPEQRRQIANHLFTRAMKTQDKNAITEGFQEFYFQSNGRNYLITPKSSLVFRVVCWVFRFFKIMEKNSRVDYKIVRSNIPALLYKPRLIANVSEKPVLRVDSFDSRMKTARPYFDPFTELATVLFQDYEPFHSWHDVKDHPRRDGSKYQIIIEDSALIAKPIAIEHTPDEVVQTTLKTYRDYVYSQFGERVMKRIQTHYEFDLDQMIKNSEPLTPEIVYRINVGSSHIEYDDVLQLADDLKHGKPLPERLKKRAETLSIQNIDPANPEHFAELMEILRLSESEQSKIFTGRKLHGKISSWYTTGGEQLFKPWADQQEFTQTCLKIPHRSWSCFYEDLAMILCKKHLHQKNPDQTYRVGALIPAPKDKGKPQYYYKVSSWIHNSRGIYSYTLEPTCPESGLPAIKLYRSTSVSAYNLDGAASYKNDFNPINPPGYEGAHLLERHEKEFFDKRTIPVWVGYQHQAAQKLALNRPELTTEIRENLLSANRALIEEVEAKYKKPSLRKYIRKYDSEFMELIHNLREAKVISSYKAWYLLNNSLRNTVRYKNKVSSKEVQYLKSVLEKAAMIPKFQKEAKMLLSWWNWENRQPSAQELDFIAELNRHETYSSLEEWSRHLLDIAKSRKEDIASKQAQNLDFVGHSLGGSCAQLFLVYYTSAMGRIPLPGHSINARVFDDPAINKSDNKLFIDFGNRHGELLKAQGSHFGVIRRQETGDPVPQTGGIHLGAIKTFDQEKKSVTWLRFDARLQRASARAKDPQIRDYSSAHGRLFAGASSKGAWLHSWMRRKIPKLELENPTRADALKQFKKKLPLADYKVTYYDARTQWNFDNPADSKVWKDLQNLWKLPFKFTPIYAERLRSYLSAAFRSGFFYSVLPNFIAKLAKPSPPDDRAHGDWRRHCDARGIFIVKK